MHILEEKKRNHIAGYIISMWHLESIVRACDMDVDRVLQTLIPAEAPEEEKESAAVVYSTIVQQMIDEGLQESGHLKEVNELIGEMQYLHDSLIAGKQDEDYLRLHEAARVGIADLQGLAKEKRIGEILASFNGIYGVLILRARGEEISEETLNAEKLIRKMLDALSDRYRAVRSFPDPSLN